MSSPLFVPHDAIDARVLRQNVRKTPSTRQDRMYERMLYTPPVPQCASAIAFLISPMALPGFRCFGHVLLQFMIVWHR